MPDPQPAPHEQERDPVEEAKETAGPPPIEHLLHPLRIYIHKEASGGIVLLLCAVAALVWANSPWQESYESLWRTPVTVAVGDFVLQKPLLLWINDGLMALFFFVIGLEIKRELLVGELASLRRAALPIAAALGGMLVPAVLYLSLNTRPPASSGWGIPVATDIAFAIGILSLLGNRVPWALKVFLVSLAIVDDLGAVLIIAFFYTSHLSVGNLLIGAVFLFALVVANRAGIRHPLVYGLLGIGGLWLAFLLSGVHATIAGVLAAMTIPARPRMSPQEFLRKGRRFLRRFRRKLASTADVLADEEKIETARALEIATEFVQTPLQRLERGLQPWVSLGVMPLFALANAGVTLTGDAPIAVVHPVSLGVMLGLVVGKQSGIMLAAWLAVRSGLATLPRRVAWRHLYGAAGLAGIGFTMSLFIANLAFRDSDLLVLAKMGILVASVASGAVGWWILRTAGRGES